MESIPHPFEETLAAIRSQIPTELATPKIGIVCGSGLATLASHFKDKVEVAYDSLPGFVKSTVAGHKSAFAFGRLGDGEGIPVVAMLGRFHPYEGYPMAKATYPIRVMKRLGVQSLLSKYIITLHLMVNSKCFTSSYKRHWISQSGHSSRDNRHYSRPFIYPYTFWNEPSHGSKLSTLSALPPHVQCLLTSTSQACLPCILQIAKQAPTTTSQRSTQSEQARRGQDRPRGYSRRNICLCIWADVRNTS